MSLKLHTQLVKSCICIKILHWYIAPFVKYCLFTTLSFFFSFFLFATPGTSCRRVSEFPHGSCDVETIYSALFLLASSPLACST